MSPLLILIATAALGIEVGWEPLDEGGYEYSIQLEPQLLDVLRNETDEITSEVPPHIHIRRYHIFVGTGKLLRINGPPEKEAGPAAADSRPAQSTATREAPLPAASDSADSIPDAIDSIPEALDERRTAGRHESAPALDRSAAEDAAAPDTPAPLPAAVGHAEPLSSVRFDAPPDGHHAKDKKPQSGSHADQAAPAEAPRPWTALVIAIALLSCSLGANVYLGWIAWEARGRLREALVKFRAAPAG